jgi:protein-tyrosine phosphatase
MFYNDSIFAYETWAEVEMINIRAFVLRLIQAVQRRIRHQRILFTAREDSKKALVSAQRLEKVLVLCYGNIYRSPLLECLLKRHIKEYGIEVRSAGFHDKEGRCCVEEYLQLLTERGYDLTAHRSSKITHEDIAWADVIVIMDRKNWDRMNQMSPSALKKVVWVGAFSSQLTVEVEDPYDMGKEATLNVISQLERCAVDIMRQITDQKSRFDGPLISGGEA